MFSVKRRSWCGAHRTPWRARLAAWDRGTHRRPVPLLDDSQIDAELLVRFTPLRIVTAGAASVGLFFTLSGLVLALPWARGEHAHYGAFLLKRFCRLYIPFAAAVAPVQRLVERTADGKAGAESSAHVRQPGRGVIASVSAFLLVSSPPLHGWMSSQLSIATILDTLRYGIYFVAGMLLALRLEPMRILFNSHSR